MLKTISVGLVCGLVLGYFATSVYSYWDEPEVEVSTISGKPVRLLMANGQVVKLAENDDLPKHYSKVLVK